MLFYMLASSAPLMWHVFIRKERYVSICVTAGIATLLRIAYHFLTKCSKSIQDDTFVEKENEYILMADPRGSQRSSPALVET